MARRIDIAECLTAAGLAGLIAVLLVAYVDQFAGRDLPCPLCLLQRVALVGVA
jgi:disulfide bond formation protein DsbB